MKRLRPVALSRSATCLWPRSSARHTASWHSAALAPLDSSSRTTSCDGKAGNTAVQADQHMHVWSPAAVLLACQAAKQGIRQPQPHMCTRMLLIGLDQQQPLVLAPSTHTQRMPLTHQVPVLGGVVQRILHARMHIGAVLEQQPGHVQPARRSRST